MFRYPFMKSYTIQRNRVILLPVKLTGPLGERWTQAILDTGATYTMFPPAVLRAIGCEPTTGADTVKIITASTVEYVPLIQIPSLEVFGKTVDNIQSVSHILPQSAPAQGLIGINALQQFNIELNFLENRMVVRTAPPTRRCFSGGTAPPSGR